MPASYGNLENYIEKEAEVVTDLKTRNSQLKTHCMSFRDLSERLAKEVKRVNHELNTERARRQPTLRRTTMGRGGGGKSHSKKKS